VLIEKPWFRKQFLLTLFQYALSITQFRSLQSPLRGHLGEVRAVLVKATLGDWTHVALTV